MPFAAFPHQINKPIKLRRVLKVADKLLKSGKGIEDESLGYTLFLKGIIRSRKYSGTLVHQLDQIKKEDPSDQSPLTTARDLRRLFLLFGFVVETKDGFRLTERGRVIVKASGSKLTERETEAWYEGLLELKWPEDSPAYRPAKVMLEMLAEGPILTKSLAFAFNVTDEKKKSVAKVRRVAQRISTTSELKKALKKAGIKFPSANNSVKILPPLMESVELISRQSRMSSLLPFGRTLIDNPSRWKPTAKTPLAKRESWYRVIAPDDDLKRRWKPAGVEARNVEFDPSLLRERTILHQATLEKLCKQFGKKWRLCYGHFDLLAEKGGIAMLAEVKTLKAGNARDERLRIIDGVGKLFYYIGFNVPSALKRTKATIQKVMVFSRKPTSKEHVSYLRRLGIWVLWFDDAGKLSGDTTSLRSFGSLIK